MIPFLKKLAFFLLLAFVILFGYQNLEALSSTAKFHFDFYLTDFTLETPELPVVFLFVAFFLLGMLAAGIQGFYERLARHIDIRKRDRRIRDLEKEVAELRSQLEPPSNAEEPGLLRPAAPAGRLEDNPTL